jgi:hypothetical protein
MKSKNLSSTNKKLPSAKNKITKNAKAEINLAKKDTNIPAAKIENYLASHQINVNPTYSDKWPNLKFVNSKNFNIDDFIKYHTDDHLKCLICSQVLIDPVSCYKCNKISCSKCIKSELEKHSKCPGCFNIIFFELMPVIDINNWEVVKGKEVTCPYEGCIESFPIFTIRPHLETCVFKTLNKYSVKHVNKIIYEDKSKDPHMKTYLLDYLKNVNCKLNITNTTEDCNKEFEFESKLTCLKKDCLSVNDTISKTILELAILTKSTNEKLKTIINK